MFSRRNFIRVGAASLGSLALAALRRNPRAGPDGIGLSRPGLRIPLRRQRFQQHHHPHG